MAETEDAAHSYAVAWDDPKLAGARVGRMKPQRFIEALLAGDVPLNPAAVLLGIRFQEAGEGKAVVTMLPAEQHSNYWGAMQGGLLSAVFDFAFSAAITSVMEPGFVTATLDLHTTYLRPVLVSGGQIRCEAEVVHRGNRVATAQARILDGKERLCATAVTSFVISEVARQFKPQPRDEG